MGMFSCRGRRAASDRRCLFVMRPGCRLGRVPSTELLDGHEGHQQQQQRRRRRRHINGAYDCRWYDHAWAPADRQVLPDGRDEQLVIGRGSSSCGPACSNDPELVMRGAIGMGRSPSEAGAPQIRAPAGEELICPASPAALLPVLPLHVLLPPSPRCPCRTARHPLMCSHSSHESGSKASHGR